MEDIKEKKSDERIEVIHYSIKEIKEISLKQKSVRKRQNYSSNKVRKIYKRRLYSTRQKRSIEQFANAPNLRK